MLMTTGQVMKNTISVDCEGHNTKNLLRQKIFDESFEIKGFLNDDKMLVLESKDRKQTKMVMKVSEDSDQIAKEVCNLLSIRKRLRKESKDTIANV